MGEKELPLQAAHTASSPVVTCLSVWGFHPLPKQFHLERSALEEFVTQQQQEKEDKNTKLWVGSAMETTSSPTIKFCLFVRCMHTIAAFITSVLSCAAVCSLVSVYIVSWWSYSRVSLSSVWASLWFILNICFWQVSGTTRSALWACDVAIITASASLCMCGHA